MAGIQGLAAPLRRPATTTVLAGMAAVLSIGCAAAALALHPDVPGVVGPQPADLVVATAFPLVAVLVLVARLARFDNQIGTVRALLTKAKKAAKR